MLKQDEIAQATSCWNRAGPKTRVFVVVDWDGAAPGTLRQWALERVKLGLNKPGDPQIEEAYALAQEIEDNLAAVRAARKNVATGAPWPFPG